MKAAQVDETSQWLSIAQNAVIMAGADLLKAGSSLKEINLEVGRDVKIAADVSSERSIIRYLKENSNFSILSEESGLIERGGDGFVWIVDPLDGSLNYLRGVPLCCISIGLWRDRNPVAGVVYDFFRSELFSGIPGQGAWLNDLEIEKSLIDKKENAVLCTGFPVNTDFSERAVALFIQQIRTYKKIRLFGSAALSLAYVAAGRVDAYRENDIMIWDVAGGAAVASAAGCSVDIKNGSIPNSLNVVVTNGKFNVSPEEV